MFPQSSSHARIKSLTKLQLFPALCLLLISAALFDAPNSLASSAKPRLTLDEFFSAVDFTAIALSPDGHMVAIATSRADWNAQRFREDLWLWRDSNGALIPLTQSGHDSDPKWSPDGQWIAFLSDRDTDDSAADDNDDKADKKGAVHVYLIPVSGGEAFPVTRGAEDVHTFAWSPDSKTLYFATRQPLSTKSKRTNARNNGRTSSAIASRSAATWSRASPSPRP